MPEGDTLFTLNLRVKKNNPQSTVDPERVTHTRGILEGWASGIQAQLATLYPEFTLEAEVTESPQ